MNQFLYLYLFIFMSPPLLAWLDINLLLKMNTLYLLELLNGIYRVIISKAPGIKDKNKQSKIDILED